MVLRGSTFSDKVQSRIKNYDLVTDPNVSPDDDLFVEVIAPISIPKDRVQAVPITGSQEPGYSAVYRNRHLPDRLVSTPHLDLHTSVDMFEASLAHGPDMPCFGERQYDSVNKKWGQYEFQTYAQVNERAKNIASGIVSVVKDHVGLEPHAEQYTVGLFGPNTRNWAVADLACSMTALTSVPLYDTLGTEATQYIINLVEMPIIFASLAHIPFIFANKAKFPTVKVVVSLDNVDNTDGAEREDHSKRNLLTQWAKSTGVHFCSIYDLEANGKKNPRTLRKLVPEDVQTLCFTSGTTGIPKGVIITASGVCAAICVSKYNSAFMNQDEQVSYLSFLPLAHIYERLNLLSLLAGHARVGFLHGEVTEVFDDIAALKPSLIAGVPRIWNRLASALKSLTIESTGLAGFISRKAFAAKSDKLAQTGDYTHFFWDRVWSNKARKKLGLENTLAFISGSAPLAAENVELLKCVLALDCLQGYGLTESLSGISVTMMGDIGAGSVGPVSPTTEVRLRELPDMGYTASDNPYPRGEIMLRGPQMFKGYYKNEKETDNAFDKDGWFHTGDVGMIDQYGRLYVIDRVKNMFKLAQGEYVGPERIESIYQSSSSLISQIFVDGNSLEVFLVSIVGVMPETYVVWLKNRFGKTIDPTNTAALTDTFNDKTIRKAFNEEINKDAKKAGLKGFEMVKNLALFIEPMTSDNGILTPTLKVKRKEAAAYFKESIKAMYEEGQLIGGAQKAMAKL